MTQKHRKRSRYERTHDSCNSSGLEVVAGGEREREIMSLDHVRELYKKNVEGTGMLAF